MMAGLPGNLLTIFFIKYIVYLVGGFKNEEQHPGFQ
jgi:hypothetical protein